MLLWEEIRLAWGIPPSQKQVFSSLLSVYPVSLEGNMNCVKCGHSTPSEATECEKCGEALVSSAGSSGPAGSEGTGSSKNEDPKSAQEQEAPAKGRSAAAVRKQDKATNRKISLWGFVGIGALVLIILLILFKKMDPIGYFESKSREMSQARNPVSAVEQDPFFSAFREAFREVADGKTFFRLGQRILYGDATTGGLDPSQRGAYAALNFARADEHFDVAAEKLKNLKNLETGHGECRDNLVLALDKFYEAAKLFGNYAKAYQEGSLRPGEDNNLTDAQAKFEIADKTMAQIMLEGCKGKFFQFIKTQKPPEIEKMYRVYHEFFAENFEPNRVAIQQLLGYPSAADPRASQ